MNVLSAGKLVWWSSSRRGWLREWMREQHEREQRDCWHMDEVFASLLTCLSPPFSPTLAAQGGWRGAGCLPTPLCYGLQITGCHQPGRGLHASTPWRGARLYSFAFIPNLCSTSPAQICYTSFKWIYGPINGESLCIIKSRADLSGIQFNNYLSNSVIFRYVVSVPADLEDLLGAFDRQDSTFYCSVTKPVLHRPCTHLVSGSKLQKVRDRFGVLVWAWTWRRMYRGLAPALPHVWGPLHRLVRRNVCLCVLG